MAAEADFDTITIPRPKPDEVAFAITDAEGASAWTTIRKADLTDGAFLAKLAEILEDAQRLVHEERAAAASK